MLFKGLFIDWSLKVIPVRRVIQELLHSLVQFSMDSSNAKLLIFRPDIKTNCLFYFKFRQKQLSCRIHPCPGLAQWRTDEDCPPPATGRRWPLVIIAILIDRNIIIIVTSLLPQRSQSLPADQIWVVCDRDMQLREWILIFLTGPLVARPGGSRQRHKCDQRHKCNQPTSIV